MLMAFGARRRRALTFFKLTAKPEQRRRPRRRFVLAVGRARGRKRGSRACAGEDRAKPQDGLGVHPGRASPDIVIYRRHGK